MSLAGHGAVAIWNDIAPEGRQIFYAWHGVEHIPERVGIPGFLRGRRYVAIHGNPEYFTLYETESPQVLTGQDYTNRLNHPTPWTGDAIRHFRNVARSLCRVAVSHGGAQGGLIATWRYDVPDHEIGRHREAMARRILPEIAEREGICGAHLLIADTDASAQGTAESKVRAEPNRVPRMILLLESWDDTERFDAFCRETLVVRLPVELNVADNGTWGLYRLQISRAKMARSAG
jgi:hypothetical protein